MWRSWRCPVHNVLDNFCTQKQTKAKYTSCSVLVGAAAQGKLLPGSITRSAVKVRVHIMKLASEGKLCEVHPHSGGCLCANGLFQLECNDGHLNKSASRFCPDPHQQWCSCNNDHADHSRSILTRDTLCICRYRFAQLSA